MRLAEHCGWWWPFKHLVVLTEKPTTVRRDERNRLHCESGPAVDYGNTWSIWAWHGVRVTERIIRCQYDAAEVLREQNAEVKRTMIERMGIERFFAEAHATEVARDLDTNGNLVRLLRIPLAEMRNGFIQAVEVQCPSTGRRYIHRVPDTVRTPAEARAAMWGLKPSIGIVKGQVRHGDILLTPVNSFNEYPTGFGPERES